MRDAVIVAVARTAVGRAKKGTTRTTRPEALVAAVLHSLLEQSAGRLDPALIDDFILGCAMPEGPQGLNPARLMALQAGLPVSVPAQTVNRFCSSGLQSIAIGAERIIANGADVIIAGGVETMSLVPMTGFHISPDYATTFDQPEMYIGMGLTAERVAEQYGVAREDQDRFAYESHAKAAAATDAGKFIEEIAPVRFEQVTLRDGERYVEQIVFDTDEHLRRDTTLEGLGKLKPAFKQGGTVTAGNASPLSDGAAAVLLMEGETAARLGFTPLARFAGFNVAGVAPEIMGIGPVAAVPRALKRAGLALSDLDLIELNEAFAAQALAVIRTLEMDPARVNVNGGAIALGHPLGCTGAKLTVQLLHELKRRGGRYGMVTMCIGGGQGAAGIFERL
ncbi:MAG: acetyl-CoA C-acyltransferase [Chloroflexota bacterium]|jgi:acetyl-CoA acyltransferase|nr:acetyl-CoA C-acyltransferase [Anaerolineae bacterium]HMM29563.1 acetyl-CoA C-acyltransferase [Aggregatilineaceae bacterium]